MSDNTAEWIDFNQECALISQGIVYARVRNAVYPVLYFWATPLADKHNKSTKTYKENGIINHNNFYQFV
jgi:hypothetical protein